MDAEQNLLTDEARIGELVRSAKRIAVLGIRGDRRADRPAHYVPEFLQAHGAEIVPVPVGDEGDPILGAKPVPSLRDVQGPVDIVDVFRKPADIPAHVPDLLALRPRAVWFQLGIRNDEAAQELARAGILVVQDHCLKVEWAKHRR